MLGRGVHGRGTPGIARAGALVALSLATAATQPGVTRLAAATVPGGDDRGTRAAVGVRTFTFVDRSRPTPADPTAGITPSATRSIPTTIYYPSRSGSPGPAPVAGAKPAGGRHPLVLFAPGAPGVPEDYEVLLADWAAHGYVVAALQFPVSSLAGPDDVAWTDLPDQSDDVRRVLTEVLRLEPGADRIPEIDEERIAVAGHSFGGATALSLVSACCRDRRVDAAAVLATVVATEKGPDLRRVRGPVLFVHARRDAVVPYAPAHRACARTREPRRMLRVHRIRGERAHVVPYLGRNDPYSAVVRPAIVDFFDGYVRDRRAARARLRAAGSDTSVAAMSRCPAADGVTPRG